MPIRVEFFGIPRQRAGQESLEIEATDLAAAIDELTRLLPQLSDTVFKNGQIKAGFLANINGANFTTDPHARLEAGDCLLILSADVGG